MMIIKTKNLIVLSAINLAYGVAVLSLTVVPILASAQTMEWDVENTVPGGASNSSDNFAALKAGRVYINNDLGASILKLDSANVSSDTVFNVPWGEQVVYAKYEPATATGTIFVARSIRTQNGDGMLEVAQWRPQYFDAYKQDFTVQTGALCRPMNPFHEFVPAEGSEQYGRGMFEKINFQAFRVAVGMVMQHVSASEGWIAYSQTQTHKEEHHDGGFLKKSVTIEFDAYTKPRWIAATPTNISSGHNVSTVVAVPNSTENSVDNCIKNNPMSIGAARQTKLNGSVVGGVKLLAGVNFIEEGTRNSLPHGNFHAFHHEETESGFGSFGLATVISLASFGSLAVLDALTGNSIASFIDDEFFFHYPDQPVPDGTAFAPVSDEFKNAADSRVDYGSSNSSDEASGLVTIDLDKVEERAYVGDSGDGQSNSGHADSPLYQDNDWDPYPNVARGVNAPLGQTNGGFKIQANRAKPDPGQMSSKTVMSVIQHELGETLNYDTSPYGDPGD